MVPSRRMRSWLVPVATLFTSTPAWAAPGEIGDVEAESEAERRPEEHAQLLYDRGKTKFEAARYEEAVEFWTRAYAILPEDGQASELKVFILYDLVTALERAHETDGDPLHLQRARALLEQRQRWLTSSPAGNGGVDDELARLEARLDDIDSRTPSESISNRSVAAPVAVGSRVPDRGVTSPRRVRALIGTASVSLILGAAGVAGLATGLAIRDPSAEGELGSAEALALAGGAVAGVGLLAGSVLLAVGLRERRWLEMAVVPWGNHGGAGAWVSARF